MAGRGKLIAMAMTATMVIGTASMSSAANPQLRVPSASVSNNGDLLISVRVTGLGSTETVTVEASGNAQAIYGCVNGSGKVPNAANKRDMSEDFDVSAPFTTTTNGSARGTLTVDVPDSPVDFSCPGGQRLRLLSVSYFNVEVSWDVDEYSSTIPVIVAPKVFYS